MPCHRVRAPLGEVRVFSLLSGPVRVVRESDNPLVRLVLLEWREDRTGARLVVGLFSLACRRRGVALPRGWMARQGVREAGSVSACSVRRGIAGV